MARQRLQPLPPRLTCNCYSGYSAVAHVRNGYVHKRCTPNGRADSIVWNGSSTRCTPCKCGRTRTHSTHKLACTAARAQARLAIEVEASAPVGERPDVTRRNLWSSAHALLCVRSAGVCMRGGGGGWWVVVAAAVVVVVVVVVVCVCVGVCVCGWGGGGGGGGY